MSSCNGIPFWILEINKNKTKPFQPVTQMEPQSSDWPLPERHNNHKKNKTIISTDSIVPAKKHKPSTSYASTDWPQPERHTSATNYTPSDLSRLEPNPRSKNHSPEDWPAPESYSSIIHASSDSKKSGLSGSQITENNSHLNRQHESPRRSLRAGIDTANQKIKNMSAYFRSKTPGKWEGSQKFTKLNVRSCNDNNFDKVGKIYIAKSTIPNAGNGLFADTDFLPGDVLVEYSGILYHSLDTSYISPMKDTSYIVENNAGWCLDALPLLNQDIPMQYVGGRINSCTKDQVSQKQNCYWYLFDHKCGKYSSINQIHPNSVACKFKTPEFREAAKERRYFVATKKNSKRQ